MSQVIMITEAQYKDALAIVNRYEAEKEDKYNIQVEAFRKDLANYFLNDAPFKITQFSLVGSDIIPKVPSLQECLSEEDMDEEIEKLAKKHYVNFSMIYWCYRK